MRKNKITSLTTLLAVALVLSSGITLAAGPLDGIYNCQFSSASGNISQIFVAVNSNASTTVVTIPNLQGVLYYGYVAGLPASETAFNGTSSYGYPFAATATGAVGAKRMSVSGTVYTAQYGPVTGKGACTQII